jgi:hypothetical protein
LIAAIVYLLAPRDRTPVDPTAPTVGVQDAV